MEVENISILIVNTNDILVWYFSLNPFHFYE